MNSLATPQDLYRSVRNFPETLAFVLGKGDMDQATALSYQDAQLKRNQQYTDTHGVRVIVKEIFEKSENSLNRVESSMFVVTLTGDRQSQTHTYSFWTLFWEKVKLLRTYPHAHPTFYNAVDNFDRHILPLLMIKKEQFFRSRAAGEHPDNEVPQDEVMMDAAATRLQQQWSEIMGSDDLAFAARVTYKVESALSQECEATRGIKDLLNNVERRQKDYVAKTEMGLWTERSSRPGNAIWRHDLWMLANGGEPLTERNLPSWQLALYRVGQLLTKMLGLEAVTQLQLGGILPGMAWGAIALYDVTRRAVRGGTG